jgi:hypothetical protein
MNRGKRALFPAVCAVTLLVAGSVRADLVETNLPPSAMTVSTNAPTSAAAATNAEPGTLDALFNRELPDAIGRSKINFEWRPRYEYADTETAKPSDAFTMRTVFGLTTAELYGFQGMIEGLNVLSVGNSDNYYAGNNPSANDKALVLDPPTTEINQAWVSYTYTNWAASGKGGRQVINLDNLRFIGSVDWRQNPQTFDAIRLDNTSIEKLDLLYAYLGRVNRVGGNVPDLLPGAKDFQSSSHVLHANYDSCDYADLTGYIYLLDLENGVGSAASCATYGLSVVGKAPMTEALKLDYRGEFAWQTDYADNPNSYSAPYLHLTLGSKIQPVSFGVGYELLGSDNNVGFQTPLATLHAFNGWADVFLNTPRAGLQDLYVWGQVEMPWELPLKVMLHKFDAASDGLYNYGNEIDVSVSKKLGKHWTALVKYAFYDAVNAAPGAQATPANVQKFWVQVDFKL